MCLWANEGSVDSTSIARNPVHRSRYNGIREMNRMARYTAVLECSDGEFFAYVLSCRGALALDRPMGMPSIMLPRLSNGR